MQAAAPTWSFSLSKHHQSTFHIERIQPNTNTLLSSQLPKCISQSSRQPSHSQPSPTALSLPLPPMVHPELLSPKSKYFCTSLQDEHRTNNFIARKPATFLIPLQRVVMGLLGLLQQASWRTSLLACALAATKGLFVCLVSEMGRQVLDVEFGAPYACRPLLL
jgi:hypothetical protein